MKKVWTNPGNAMTGKRYTCSKLKNYLSECKFKGQKLVNVYKASSADNSNIHLEELSGDLPNAYAW